MKLLQSVNSTNSHSIFKSQDRLPLAVVCIAGSRYASALVSCGEDEEERIND
jgi:hypothetical protein